MLLEFMKKTKTKKKKKTTSKIKKTFWKIIKKMSDVQDNYFSYTDTCPCTLHLIYK